MLLPKPNRMRDKEHRKFVSSLPCVVCKKPGPSDCAHIRIGGSGGMGLKSGDDTCVSLCHEHHQLQHTQGERTFWGDNLKDAQLLAKTLYHHTGNKDACLWALIGWKKP